MAARRGRPATPPQDRFWAKVEKTETCWIWTGAPTAEGYGRFRVGDRKVLVHRYSWELHGGERLAGRELDHRCLNRLCVNPDHLRIASRKQNNENKSGSYRSNPTGVRGVTLNAKGRPFQAIVTHDGARYYLGRFDSLQDADDAATRMRLKLFTHNEVDKSKIPSERNM